MGQIITLQDTYQFEIPTAPTREKDVLFFDKKKTDQYWQRPEIPNLKRMASGARLSFIDEERRRLAEGVYMFINGEPVYITGKHYDFLMYTNLPDFPEPPRYYNSQRLDYYFKKFIEEDPNCFGELTIKARRYGYTAMAISDIILTAISDFAQNIGMISTDLDKVKESIFRPLVDSFLQRPKYVRPEIYMPNGRPPQKELRFRKNVIEESEDGDLNLGDGLRSWISPRSCTAKAFDGHKWQKVIFDEIYKWTKASLYRTWNITKETLAVGGTIIGKAHLFATMGDDDTMEAAVQDGIKLWGESDYQNRNRFGRTQSGLYRWFIPAFSAYELFIDKYGTCDEERAKEYLLEERSHLQEGTKDYIYHVRKYPFTPEEAMSSALASSTFSGPRLAKRATTLYLRAPSEKGYITGMFKEDPTTGRIYFAPTPTGYWKLRHFVHEKSRNRCRSVNGMWVLPRNPEGVIGNDPVRTSENVSGHLSMNCAYVYQKFDYFNNGTGNRLLAQLYGRDEDVDVFNQQLEFACRYFGYPLNTERQITSTLDWFRTHGMFKFLLKGPDGATGTWMTSKLIKEGVEMIQALIKKPSDPDMIDFLDTIDFEELIESLKNFSVSKSTKFDPVMALILVLLGAMQIKYFPVPDQYRKGAAQVMGALFPVR